MQRLVYFVHLRVDLILYSHRIVRLPTSNRHGHKRPYTEKYDDLHGPVLRSYITVSYTEKYGDLRRKKRSFTAFVHRSRIRSPFCSVYNRIAPYTVTEICDRNTVPYNTEKYGSCTVVYERIRTPYSSIWVESY
jgi:hypothetical protein